MRGAVVAVACGILLGGQAVAARSAKPLVARAVVVNGRFVAGAHATARAGVLMVPVEPVATALGWHARRQGPKLMLLCSDKACVPIQIGTGANTASVVNGKLLMPAERLASLTGSRLSVARTAVSFTASARPTHGG